MITALFSEISHPELAILGGLSGFLVFAIVVVAVKTFPSFLENSESIKVSAEPIDVSAEQT